VADCLIALSRPRRHSSCSRARCQVVSATFCHPFSAPRGSDERAHLRLIPHDRNLHEGEPAFSLERHEHATIDEERAFLSLAEAAILLARRRKRRGKRGVFHSTPQMDGNLGDDVIAKNGRMPSLSILLLLLRSRLLPTHRSYHTENHSIHWQKGERGGRTRECTRVGEETSLLASPSGSQSSFRADPVSEGGGVNSFTAVKGHLSDLGSPLRRFTTAGRGRSR